MNETDMELISNEFSKVNSKLDQIGEMVYQLQKENAALKSIIAKLLPSDQLGNYQDIQQQAQRDELAAQFK